jgi:type II restriction/modification system DNA methylase subunit YeeA
MTTIRQAAYITSNRHAAYWLRQVNRDLPYGDCPAMVAAALAEGATVTQISEHRFLVDNNAWMTAWGTTEPVEA